MFTALVSTLTDTEIAADIATCRAVLKAGAVNGITLDSDGEDTYRDWLADLEEERQIRLDALSDAEQTRIEYGEAA